MLGVKLSLVTIALVHCLSRRGLQCAEVDVCKASASPAVHKRMTGKCLFDVFGGLGFLAKASKSSVIVWPMCSIQKFGPKYDVTKPVVLTRIRQHVSAGKSVAGMISTPRLHTSCSSQVISASAAIACLLHRARRPWILENPFDSLLLGPPGGSLYSWISMQTGERYFWWECGQQRFASYWHESVLGLVDVAV